MGMFYPHRRGGKRLQKKPRSHSGHRARLTALFLCLSMMAGFLPTLASAEDDVLRLSQFVDFSSITLHYAGSDATVEDGALIEKDRQLVLRYTYHISEEQCKGIKAGINYYLNVSPHLVVNDLENGSSLTIKTETGLVPFGKIYAQGNKAWVTFDSKENSVDTVLSEYGELNDAYFYLNCSRAGDVPAGETPVEGHSNLYAIKVENEEILRFGYAENEPVTAKAQITKGGTLKDKTITWTIDYTPWQNPAGSDGVTLDTPFELRDIIDTSLHSYIVDSVTIDGSPVTACTSRDNIPSDAETYVLAESSDDGERTTLTFGGTKFNAVKATKGKPAQKIVITYKTSIKDELLLPGGDGGKKVTNAAELFAGKDGVFTGLNITGQYTVPVSQPKWLEKTGTTTRHTDGTGSTTDWKVTFHRNGFTDLTELTLHDRLPAGSTLVNDSVKVDEPSATVVTGEGNSFTVAGITAGAQDVVITYTTSVPEEMYDDGMNLGSNVAWFTFQYNGKTYTTPQAKKDVGSGDGTGTPGTARLVKTNTGYHAADRTIKWTVTINPHKANLRSGTFVDDLSKTGPQCTAEHTGGLDVVGGKDGIQVLVGGSVPADESKVKVTYSNQKITVETQNVGAQAITLTYTTKVCDPCVFANNTTNVPFKNTISTDNMVIGSSDTGRSASADSTVNVSAAVLKKNPPVYDYTTGIMTWTVEVNAAGLSMENVVLTDKLPDGLTYVDGSLTTAPEIAGASASAAGQELTINLGGVTANTTVTFQTRVDPLTLGFGGGQPVVVENTIHMNGTADGVEFAEVSHHVQQSFSNHGLVKSSAVNNQQELIQYEVLINPYHLALPENPSLVDTLDKRLQLDTDTLRFYKAELTGTTLTNADQRPNYTKKEEGQPLSVTNFDPDTNSFTVELPIAAGDRDAYVLTYTADIIRREAGGYGNSVRFDGGSVLLGGSKNNSASVGGGGGGGGGGVAARKAAISIVKTDSETQAPLAGVTFTLYQWDSGKRGLPFAQGETGADGKLSFKVKPGALYELVETGSAPGYGSAMGWTELPDGAVETGSGLLITAGAAKSELKLELTNEAHTTDLVFRLFNTSGIPMAGAKVQLFRDDPGETETPDQYKEVEAGADGTVKFSGVRRGAKYFIRRPGGEIMTVEVPAKIDETPAVKLPDGTSAALTPDYAVQGSTPTEEQWTLTVRKVRSGSETPLAGAVIGLYADEACRTLIKTGVSGQDGTISFSGLIKAQRYWLKETAAPPDYKLDSTVHAAEEVNPAVIIENEPMEQPAGPDAPAGPDTPDQPGIPDRPNIPNKPDKPSRPDTSDKTDAPDEPGAPAEPGTSEEPGTAGEPGTSDQPGMPDGPDAPNEPEISDEPGASNGADTSGEPGTAGEPDALVNSDSGETGNSTGDSNIPQTGDNTRLLMAAALVSGILLAAMTLYRLLGSKKREKR